MEWIDDVKPLEGYHPEIGVLLASWKDGTREWAKENLGSPTPEALRWQAYEGGPSIGAIMMHMISCDIWWIESVALGLENPTQNEATEFDKQIDQMNGVWPTPPDHPAGWYFDLMLSTRERLFELLRGQDQSDRICRFKEYQFTLRWIIAHLVQHDSYHGGQAVMLHEQFKRTLV